AGGQRGVLRPAVPVRAVVPDQGRIRAGPVLQLLSRPALHQGGLRPVPPGRIAVGVARPARGGHLGRRRGRLRRLAVQMGAVPQPVRPPAAAARAGGGAAAPGALDSLGTWLSRYRPASCRPTSRGWPTRRRPSRAWPTGCTWT